MEKYRRYEKFWIYHIPSNPQQCCIEERAERGLPCVSVSSSMRKGWYVLVHDGQGHAQLGGVDSLYQRVRDREGERLETMWSQRLWLLAPTLHFPIASFTLDFHWWLKKKNYFWSPSSQATVEQRPPSLLLPLHTFPYTLNSNTWFVLYMK